MRNLNTQLNEKCVGKIPSGSNFLSKLLRSITNDLDESGGICSLFIGLRLRHFMEKLFLTHTYCKNHKNSDTQKMCCNHPKIWTTRLYHWKMGSKDVDRIANSVDPDQTAPALYAQTCLSENLRTLRYDFFNHLTEWIGWFKLKVLGNFQIYHCHGFYYCSFMLCLQIYSEICSAFFSLLYLIYPIFTYCLPPYERQLDITKILLIWY